MKEFPLRLLEDFVAVKLESSTQTSTIMLPDWQVSLRGSVLACGPDCKELNVGDLVQFGAASGMDSWLDGDAIRIMREERDVLCAFDR